MILYKTGNLIYFEDSIRSITGAWYPEINISNFIKISPTAKSSASGGDAGGKFQILLHDD